MATNQVELSEPVGWLVAPCSSVVGWLPDLAGLEKVNSWDHAEVSHERRSAAAEGGRRRRAAEGGRRRRPPKGEGGPPKAGHQGGPAQERSRTRDGADELIIRSLTSLLHHARLFPDTVPSLQASIRLVRCAPFRSTICALL